MERSSSRDRAGLSIDRVVDIAQGLGPGGPGGRPVAGVLAAQRGLHNTRFIGDLPFAQSV